MFKRICILLILFSFSTTLFSIDQFDKGRHRNLEAIEYANSLFEELFLDTLKIEYKIEISSENPKSSIKLSSSDNLIIENVAANINDIISKNPQQTIDKDMCFSKCEQSGQLIKSPSDRKKIIQRCTNACLALVKTYDYFIIGYAAALKNATKKQSESPDCNGLMINASPRGIKLNDTRDTRIKNNKAVDR